MNTTVIAAKVPAIFGAVLIITGIIIPPSTLIAWLRTVPEPLRDQLILGATLFKIAMVLNGLFIIFLALVTTARWREQKEQRASGRNLIFPSLALAGILFAAFLLRAYNLNSGIWFDEIITYVSYMNRPFGEILTTYDNQNNHVLYTLFARLSFLIFGESVWSLRLPAVLFGVGSIWALYLFASELGTWRVGLLSAGFLTVSYHHVWFSQNARGYTALLFWTMLSSWFLLRALREAKLGLWLMYGITTALGMLTHMTMIFVVVAQGVVYLVSLYDSDKESRREKWLGGLAGFIVAGLLTFQFYALVVPQLFNWQGGGVASWQGKVAVAPWKSPIWMMGELLRGANIGFGNSVLVLLALVFGGGLWNFARKKSPVAVLFIVSVLTGLTVIIGIGSTLLPRFFFYAMGFAAIILVRGLMLSGDYLSRALRVGAARAPAVGIALCIAAIAGSAISVTGAYQPKQDYGAALEFVQNQQRPGDSILTVDLTVLPYRQFYKVDWDNVTTLAELDAARSRAARTWLIYTMPIVLQAAYPEIMKSIATDFETIRIFSGSLKGGDIVVSRAKSPVR